MENNVNKKIKIEKFFVIDDYFVFDQNDIDLYKMKKCFDNYQSKFEMTEKDIKAISDNCQDLIIFFQKNDSLKNTFPILKNSVLGYIDTIFKKYNNKYLNYYFFMLILSNRKNFSSVVKNYYFHVIQNNYISILPNYSNVLTTEVMTSPEYNSFTSYLADWYTNSEMIIFYITIINNYFHIYLNFDEKKYSLETNYEFSLKSFAKKNFFKLASYACRHISIDVKLGQVDYKKLILLIASSFTCGISVKDFFTNDFKQLAFLGGFVINYLIRKIAVKMENYSNFVEFTRLEEVIKKLNKKLKEIHTKVYELVKLLIFMKLDPNESSNNISLSFIKCGNESSINSENTDTTNDSKNSNRSSSNLEFTYEIYPQISSKIDELIHEIKTYFEGVECPNEETENNLIKEAQNIEEELILNSIGNEEWVFLKICKNK